MACFVNQHMFHRNMERLHDCFMSNRPFWRFSGTCLKHEQQGLKPAGRAAYPQFEKIIRRRNPALLPYTPFDPTGGGRPRRGGGRAGDGWLDSRVGTPSTLLWDRP
jgi:hypothetical protein